jgi:acyl phosphate:glycerol-3-phosphate acyltransferase
MNWWVIAAAIVSGYALGMVNPAAIVARVRGLDLRVIGSGNPGATNLSRALGRQWGIAVAALDIAKGFIPAFIFTWFFGFIPGEVAGLAAVVGHVTSPLLKGRGGKGVATTFGAVLGVVPILAIPPLIAFVVGYLLIRQVGVASIIGAVVLGVTGIVAGQFFGYPGDVALFANLLAVIVVARHQSNIRQIFNPQARPETSTAARRVNRILDGSA